MVHNGVQNNMALDITITTDIKAEIEQVITTNNTRVKGIYFDFDTTQATAMISFGTLDGDIFTEVKSENWILSGVYYQTQISETTSGKSIAEELLTKVATIVSTIQGDPTLKAQLLESEELKIN